MCYLISFIFIKILFVGYPTSPIVYFYNEIKKVEGLSPSFYWDIQNSAYLLGFTC